MPIKVRLVLYSNGFGFKGWSQNKHEKDLLFSWILEMWIFRFPIWLNTFLQCGHFIFHVWVQLLWWYNIFFLFVTSLTFCTNPRFDSIMNNHNMISGIVIIWLYYIFYVLVKVSLFNYLMPIYLGCTKFEFGVSTLVITDFMLEIKIPILNCKENHILMVSSLTETPLSIW